MSNNIDWTKLSEVEKIKDQSNYLRGTLVESLADPVTGAIAMDDRQVSKFHGIYQQHDRDLEKERKSQKLEPAWSFLIRVRLPGGVSTPAQWLQMDHLASVYGNETFKLTTRQAFQLHGILKRNLKQTVKEINDALLDSIAACGDVNRNVMCHPNPGESALHTQISELANKVSDHLLPSSTAYHEIWLDKELVAGGANDHEPIYGKHYLPRKFKIAFVIPPYNDSDVFSQDLGFIAIVEEGKLQGFNVCIGGGFGTTFGNAKTYPRLADVIGFCTPEQVVEVAEKVVLVQRDHGDRADRKQARLKYTIDRLGLANFIQLLSKELGYELEAARPYHFTQNGDRYGWKRGEDGTWSYTLFVEGGRIVDVENFSLRTALREIASFHDGQLILTGNQNVVIANASAAVKKKIDKSLNKYGVKQETISGLRKNSIACVAFNTCTLAFAEAERYLPTLISKIEDVLTDVGLFHEDIVIRMTGCPNGCGRPYLGEIGLIGKSLGRYNLYLGAGFVGNRLNNLYKETLSEEEILAELKPILTDYANNRNDEERFGDFVIRKEYVKAIVKGSDFKH